MSDEAAPENGIAESLDNFIENNVHLYTVIGIFGALALYLTTISESGETPLPMADYVYMAVYSIVAFCLSLLIFKMDRHFRPAIFPPDCITAIYWFYTSLHLIILIAILRFIVRFHEPVIEYITLMYIAAVIVLFFTLIHVVVNRTKDLDNHIKGAREFTLTIVLSLLYYLVLRMETWLIPHTLPGIKRSMLLGQPGTFFRVYLSRISIELSYVLGELIPLLILFVATLGILRLFRGHVTPRILSVVYEFANRYQHRDD